MEKVVGVEVVVVWFTVLS